MQAKTIHVETKFDETGKEFAFYIKPEEKGAEIIVDNLECSDAYTLSYRLDGDHEWKYKRGQINIYNDNIFIENLQSDSTYLVNMTVYILSESSVQSSASFQLQQFRTKKTYNESPGR